MRSFGLNRWLLTLGVLMAAGPGLARAQGITMKADDIIAARQGGMAVTGAVSNAMKAGVQSGADVKPFADDAAAIAKWAMAYPALFPDGTQVGHDTKAKPEVWSDRAGFDKAAATLVSSAQRLSEAAKSGDKAAFSAAYTTTTQACGGCHRNYKER